MLNYLIKDLKQDCLSKGRGRKKWWAEQLSIPPLTLSHWLSGRQSPSGTHALGLYALLNEQKLSKSAKLWFATLWEAYYKGEQMPVAMIILLLDLLPDNLKYNSRDLALMIHLIKNKKISLPVSSIGRKDNRFGWLMESAGLKTTFKPVYFSSDDNILSLADYSDGMQSYLKKQQTQLGRKWHIYDCPLQETVESFV